MDNARSTYFKGALVIALLLSAALGAALIAEHVYKLAPCELCLVQRWPYYFAIPVALLLVGVARADADVHWLRTGFIILTVFLIWSAALGLYHSGVEWKWWHGPVRCMSTAMAPATTTDLLSQLKTAQVVPCDQPSWRLFGMISFANMNLALSAALALFAARTLKRA